MRRMLPALAALVAAVAAGAALGGVPGTASRPAATAAAPAPSALAYENALIAVYRRVAPSVVQIQTPGGLGSGVVFDAKGHIVTNAHVVAGADTFVVTTAAGRRFPASLVGTFVPDDLAVLKVTAAGLKPATFADSRKLRVGQIAVAVGNPLGLSSSVTDGLVSAVNRQIPEGNGVTLRNAVQTSAPINPGNSGGALADIRGRVIGIPTLAATDARLGTAAAGIGFAVPSATVTDIATQLIRNGRVLDSHRAYLGVQTADTGRGVYVAAVVAGGPAAKAGIVVGDVIVAVAGRQTATADDLGAVLAGLEPGSTVDVRLVRQTSAEETVRVTLGRLPGS